MTIPPCFGKKLPVSQQKCLDQWKSWRYYMKSESSTLTIHFKLLFRSGRFGPFYHSFSWRLRIKSIKLFWIVLPSYLDVAHRPWPFLSPIFSTNAGEKLWKSISRVEQFLEITFAANRQAWRPTLLAVLSKLNSVPCYPVCYWPSRVVPVVRLSLRQQTGMNETSGGGARYDASVMMRWTWAAFAVAGPRLPLRAPAFRLAAVSFRNKKTPEIGRVEQIRLRTQ